MKISDICARSTSNTPTDGNVIQVESTSWNSAKVSPIVLQHSDSDVTRILLEPLLVDNPHDHSKSVKVKLVYEKRKKGEQYPTEKITRRSIKNGEVMEMTLDSTATQALMQNLNSLYEMYAANGIHCGQTTYTRVDGIFRSFLDIIRTNPSAARLIGNKENFALVKELLRLITQAESLESLSDALKALQDDSIASLSETVSFERLNRVISLMQDNMGNSKEEFWQKDIFTEHQWVLAQLFSTPCTILGDKVYVGGKGIGNKHGNVCDFIYQNKLSGNVILIEIKTPEAKIIQGKYRDTYSFTSELSGAVNQVINYRDKLMKEYNNISANSEQEFAAFNPKCVVIIGKLEGMNPSEKAAYENYRNSLNNIEIITFDEILQRLIDLRDVFATVDATMDDDEIQDFPF